MNTQKGTNTKKHESNAHAVAVEKTAEHIGISTRYVRESLNGKVKSKTAIHVKQVFAEKLEAIKNI